jgi:short-subunit dehydrogenase involved in D-alanine esterification of teichoic acids
MNIVITGHTRGLGKYLFDYFSKLGNTVTGLSRSNGFDINVDQEKILDIVTKHDLFINCACSKDSQRTLTLGAVNKVDNLIVIGTAMQKFKEFNSFNYIEEKKKLADTCDRLSINPNVKTNMLHLNISFLIKDKDSFLQTDNYIEYNEITNAIEYWLENKNITEMTFNWKITKLVENEFKKIIPDLDVNKLLKV